MGSEEMKADFPKENDRYTRGLGPAHCPTGSATLVGVAFLLVAASLKVIGV
jgi:hypothetical protein